MATGKKQKINKEDKFENQDVDLFSILAAIDKKDYLYYSNLTEEQKKKIVPFMLVHWTSALQGSDDIARYYLMSVNEYANKYLFNENVAKHPELVWMMLCSSSPGLGKQFHQWIPHIRERVSKLKEAATVKEIKEYFTKIYSNKDLVSDLTDEFILSNKKKLYLSNLYPEMKIEDIELLSKLVTEEDIRTYERERGNI